MITMTCSHCGSENVSLDADAAWSVETQEWELKCTYDHAECHDCAGETTIVESTIDATQARA